VKLDPEQEGILRGESGKAVALAMKTLISYGEVFGAKRLVPVKSCHLAGSFGIVMIKSYCLILERLVSEGARVKVLTTINPRPGARLNLMNRFAFLKQARLERLLEKLGATLNYSCVCYEDANVPSLGDCLGWAESSAVQYANSVLGARSNRNSALIDVCCAVTGYAPEFGYLLNENRRGQMLVKLKVKKMDASGLGFIIGQKAVGQVPVIEHFDFNRIELKNLGGSMAASGAVALFHVEGVTPEAPDLKSAFNGQPETTITITQDDLDSLRKKQPDIASSVVFGCPQMTFDETMELAKYFVGKRVKKPTWFCLVPDAKRRFEKTDLYQDVLRAGVMIYDFCPLGALTARLGNKHVLTPSGKLFYYLEGTDYGNMDDCLKACGINP